MEIVEYLQASSNGEIDKLRIFLSEGGNINATNAFKIDALMNTTWSCQLESAKFLIENGIELNQQDQDGWTALFFASCNEEQFSLIKLMLENGADPSIRNRRGNSAFENAFTFSYLHICLLFAKYAQKLDEEDQRKLSRLRFKLKIKAN